SSLHDVLPIYNTAGKCDNLLRESDPRHRIWLPCIKDAIDDIAEVDADRSAGRFEFFNGSRYSDSGAVYRHFCTSHDTELRLPEKDETDQNAQSGPCE